MKSFKVYLKEATGENYSTKYRGKTLDELIPIVTAFIKQKEIINPEYKVLLDTFKSGYRSASKIILSMEWDNGKKAPYDKWAKEPYDTPLRDKWSALHHFTSEFSYSDSPTGLLSLGKKIKQAEKDNIGNEPPVKKVKAFYEKYKSLAENLKELKNYSVKTTTIRAAAQEVKQAKFSDMVSNMQIMVDALMTQIEDAKKMAGESAEKRVDSVWANLEKRNWDIIGDMKMRGYGGSLADQYIMLTDVDPKSREKNRAAGESFKFDERFRKKSAAKKKQFVTNAMQQAEQDYKNFVSKMVQKIGQGVVHANVKGHPWSDSILTIELADKSKQVWHTQMIINYSKYGKPFNQFPSRKKK